MDRTTPTPGDLPTGSALDGPARPRGRLLAAVARRVHQLRWRAIVQRSRGRASGTPEIVAKGVRVVAPGSLHCGSRVALGRSLYVEVPVTIGEDVLISGDVAFVGNVHPLDTAGTVYGSDHSRAGDVELQGDNLVGYRAVVIAPCVFERGAVLGAGGIATGRLLADTIYGGVPARPIRTRRRPTTPPAT